jgi:hypothetical protein
MAILKTIKIDNKDYNIPSVYKNVRLELVNDRTIDETYRNKNDLSVHSCMKGSSTRFYSYFAKNVKMIRVVSDAGRSFIVHLRVLVWPVLCIDKKIKTTYIDRVYSNTDWAYKIFNKHWKDFGKLRQGGNNGRLIAKLNRPYKGYGIYLDTFRVANNTKLELSNVREIVCTYIRKNLYEWPYYKYIKEPIKGTRWKAGDKIVTLT